MCIRDSRYVTSAWPPIDENSAAAATSCYDGSATRDNDSWSRCDADPIATVSRPIDVTYCFRYPDYEYAFDPAAEDAESCRTHDGWKTGRQTFCAEDGCFGRRTSILDDVILDRGCGSGYLSTLDGTGLGCMGVLSAGRRQPTWTDCRVAVLEDGRATGSRCRVPTGNGSRLMRGIEMFKWMTVRRGSSKCVQSG